MDRNAYNRAHYERIEVFVPKGKKEGIKKAAACYGLSVNAYLYSLYEADQSRILDAMQVSAKAREYINYIASTDAGVIVALNNGSVLTASSKPEMRKLIIAEIRHLTEDSTCIP